MKLTRLFAYATVGLIVGLVIENRTLLMKVRASKTARDLGKKARRLVRQYA
jgi:hypothetical protein